MDWNIYMMNAGKQFDSCDKQAIYATELRGTFILITL